MINTKNTSDPLASEAAPAHAQQLSDEQISDVNGGFGTFEVLIDRRRESFSFNPSIRSESRIRLQQDSVTKTSWYTDPPCD